MELEYHLKLKDHNSDFLEHEPDVIIFPTQSNTGEPQLYYGSSAALRDITNIKQPKIGVSKAQPTRRSWKKLARAQANGEVSPMEPMQAKRMSIYLDEIIPQAMSSKKHFGVPSKFMLAEVAGQPRREL